MVFCINTDQQVKHAVGHNDCILLLPSFLATVSSYSYAELSFGCYYFL